MTGEQAIPVLDLERDATVAVDELPCEAMVSTWVFCHLGYLVSYLVV